MEEEKIFDKIITLGLRFRQYRKAIGLSQLDIHKKTGVALSTISLFENGKGHGLSLSHFYLLLESLELHLEPGKLIPEAHKSNLAVLWEKQNRKRKR
ncbi:MAG: helix-turn-helix transcriptional regulator [Bacteroidales bacterium]|nr:helix-turn-helix transcriptional regulator [Bacteroidales bacterium]